MKKSIPLGFICLIVSFAHNLASAQEFFADFVAPPSVPKSAFRFSASDEPGITGDRDQSRFTQQRFFISTPLNYVPTDPASISWKWSQLNIGKGLSLPSGKALPSELYESEYGLSYRHYEGENKFWGFSTSFGSSSDKPFNSKDNSTLNANVFYSQSTDPVGRWIWLVNYSNNRSFANEVPLPGFAYIYKPSKGFFGFFGFPFAFVRYQISEQWTTSALLGPYVYRFEISKVLLGPFQAYAQLDSSLQNYYLDNRAEKDHRLFISETKSLVGVRGPVSQVVFMELQGGFAFARSILESKNYEIKKDNHLLLENRWFLGTQLSARF